MAHKKGQGSTRNGRDSAGQRRGVKVYGGQLAKAGNIIVWFNVARGAFDTYLQAREICESIGAAAGWELVTNTVYTEPLTEFDVNRMIEPAPPPPPTPTPPPRTPPPGTPRPVVATPVPMPRATPPPTPIKIELPKKKLD